MTFRFRHAADGRPARRNAFQSPSLTAGIARWPTSGRNGPTLENQKALCYNRAAMKFLRFRILPNKVSLWIAIFAILMAAVAPSISQALAAQDGSTGSWIEICSSGGSKLVRLLPDGQVEHGQPSSQSTPHTGGCPFCGLHSSPALQSQSMLVGLLTTPPAFALPEAQVKSHLAVRPWPALRSRAPPPTVL